jgi:hypothetical protein
MQDLSFPDLNAVVQCHPHLHYALSNYLYAGGLKHKGGYPLWWATNHGSLGTLERLIDAEANVCWKSNFWSRSGAFPRAKDLR